METILIEAHKNGKWSLAYYKNARVTLYDEPLQAFDAMLEVSKHDFPTGTVFKIEILTEKMEPAVLKN